MSEDTQNPTRPGYQGQSQGHSDDISGKWQAFRLDTPQLTISRHPSRHLKFRPDLAGRTTQHGVCADAVSILRSTSHHTV